MNAHSIRIIKNILVVGDEVGRPESKFHTFPSLVRCRDGSLICTALVGASKSGPDGRTKVFRSTNDGQQWMSMASPTQWDEQEHPRCGYLMCHTAELAPGHLLAVYLRADRFNPNELLFHPVTSGMQHTVVRLARSIDNGATWSRPWDLDFQLPDLIVPGRIFQLPDGSLAIPFEVWHEWDKGFREGPSTRMIISRDEGRTWQQGGILARDEHCQVIYGDPRPTLLPSGRILALLWTHNFVVEKDLPVHSTDSADNGRSWSVPQSTGIAGQITNPVSLGSGKVIAVYQKRFDPLPGLWAILSYDDGRTWLPESDTLVWAAPQQSVGMNPFSSYDTYSFGYSTAFAISDDTVLVTFWSTNGQTTCIRILELNVR